MRLIASGALFFLACAHAPESGWSRQRRERMDAELAAPTTFITALPACTADELATAPSVAQVLDGGIDAASTFSVQGVLRPTLTFSTLLRCSRIETTTGYRAADVEKFLEPICCNDTGYEHRLVDTAVQTSSLVVGLVGGPSVSDCTAERVQAELARTPVVLHLEQREKRLEVKSVCRGPTGPAVVDDVPHDANEPPLPLSQAIERYALQRKHNKWGEAAFLAAMEQAAEQHAAAREYELAKRFLLEFPASQSRAHTRWRLGRTLSAGGRFAESAEVFEHEADAASCLGAARSRRLVRDDAAERRAWSCVLASHELIFRSAALRALAQLELRAQRVEGADTLLQEVLASDPQPETLALAAAVMDRLDRRDSGALGARVDQALETVREDREAREHLAAALWHLAEPDARAATERDLEGLLARYARIKTLNVPKWNIAADWRRGGLLQRFGKPVEARLAFATGLAESLRSGVLSEASLGCRLERASVSSPFPAEIPAKTVDGSVFAKPGEETMESLERVGRAYLAAELPSAARQVLNDALVARNREYDLVRGRRVPRTGALPAALAWAALREGDASVSRSTLDDALKLDPSSLEARANRAALRCRFGDVRGAREDLAFIPLGARVGGVGVDPTWERCRQKEPTW